MPDILSYQVFSAFDQQANVWVVLSTNVPGLAIEAESPVAFAKRVSEVAPTLIERSSGGRAWIKKIDVEFVKSVHLETVHF